jgi:anti-sigma factor RsiW
MRCQIVQRKLDLYAGQGLARPEYEQMEAHLRWCPACQQALARQTRLHSLLQSVASPPAPASFAERVLARAGKRETVTVQLPPSRRWAPGDARQRIRSALGMAATMAAGLLIGVFLGHGTWQSVGERSAEGAQASSTAAFSLDRLIDPGDDTLAQTYLQLTSPPDG